MDVKREKQLLFLPESGRIKKNGRGGGKVQSVDTKEYLDMVCGLLAEGKTGVPVPVAGSSMVPFLRPGDTVYLDLPREQPRRGDVVLFTRPGGRYILHRIVKVYPDGSFLMAGDAQTFLENVDGSHRIKAVVTGAVCRGKRQEPGSLRWRFFATVWLWVLPLRRQIMSGWEKLKKITR